MNKIYLNTNNYDELEEYIGDLYDKYDELIEILAKNENAYSIPCMIENLEKFQSVINYLNESFESNIREKK